MIREEGDSAQLWQGAGHGIAERGTGGNRGSAQGHTQGAGLGARGKERGRSRGQGTQASGSGGGQSAGSGRHDAGQGAGKGQGHGKDTQVREQGAKARGHRAHGVDRGVVGEQGRSQGHGHGHRKYTGAGSADQGAGDRGLDPQRGQGDKRVGAGKGPKGKGKGAVGPRGQTGRGAGATGGGRSEGRGTGGGAPPQPDVQPVQCIPPGIQQMPVHHTDHHHHHRPTSTTSTLTLETSSPPDPPGPSTSQPPPRRGRSQHGWLLPRRRGGAGRGAGAAGTWGRRGCRRGGQREPDPGTGTGTRSKTPWGVRPLPLVAEVYGWLSWACSGTTRGMRNRPFDAVLLRRDGANQEVPPGGWAAPEDHERVLWVVFPAAWPDREPTWPAFLEGGAVLRIRDVDANNWLPRALRNTLTHWRYRRQKPSPPQPQPPQKQRRR